MAFRPLRGPLLTPLKGGDWMSHTLSPISNAADWAPTSKLPISPLEGEMSGRTEGGALAPSFGKATRQETFQ
ncbi:MAG: hypothetical protein E5X80_18010 [Mesorhizobium sp.]|nr:MAG: hypothetical protein EOR71_16730 [Mesorhizobium sp.]TIO50496.1 MAG: hypothetical protein E5X78_21415 [Mesorhizobium sp.]TIO60088.1 MAG: hypothetical protein E5X79_13865 [Mesorhizobium sp.]TJV62740.1 MAG: hypothetical protein E5X80_18010 [Mesorhizobium sp.]